MIKQLYVLLALCGIPSLLVAQQNAPALFWGSNTITTDIRGGTIAKDDTVALQVKLTSNNTTIRSVYFDFQHQKDAIQLIGVERGASISANAGFNVVNNYYPNCKFNRTAQNTTTNGYTNYQNASYTCNPATVPYHAINRIMVNVSSAGTLTNDTYITLKFKIARTDAGFPYDSVYMNFGYGYDVNGTTMTNTQNTGTKGVWIQLDANENNLIVGTLSHSTNTSTGLKSSMRLSITDTLAQPTEVTNIAVGTSGTYTLAQQLNTNTSYRFRLLIPADSLPALSLSATTISDYTTAVQEFITQNLDKTYKNENIDKGIKYWAADVNNNNEFDGGDVQVLFNAVTGLDTIMVPPAGCAQNCNVTLPVIRGDAYDNLPLTGWNAVIESKTITITSGDVEWIVLSPNSYSTGWSKVLVDMRQFPAGVTPSSVTHMNILDVYSGRVIFMSNDASWATYKVPSNFVKVTNGSSAYANKIRNINNAGVDYGVSATVTTSNNNLYSTLVRTTTSQQTLDLRYALKGDVNLSHSSLVTDPAIASSVAHVVAGDLIVPGAPSIDVNLNNVVVTSNNISVPFTVDTKNIKLTGLQFEIKYDPTKVKFDKMEVTTPSWISFVNTQNNGVIRFGALDRELKNTLVGNDLVPFKLYFSSLQSGVELSSYIQVYPTMDATDDKGNQVGINFNTTAIKLIGANFFGNP